MKTEWTYKDISTFSGLPVSTLRNRAMNLKLSKTYCERHPVNGQRQRVFDIPQVQKLVSMPSVVEIVPVYKKVVYVTQTFDVYPSKINQ